MRSRVRAFVHAWLLVMLTTAVLPRGAAADVPTPESHLGYQPGADFHLPHWATVVDYFYQVAETSDRVQVRELGPTTEGRPYILVTVSSPETIGNLDRYRDFQRHLADPRTLDGDPARAERVVADSKTVVLITCTIHSTETAGTLMAMELVHDLATSHAPETREILDRTILLVVPSANPDGIDTVASWYERSKDQPWEGQGLPELYHTYAGHDTNRDWFMLNLPETQLLTRVLYKEWFPTLTYDVHQMGSHGARMFVPPFHDPINPNLHPRMHQAIAMIGAHMAAELAAAGKRGVLTHAMYDNWWNGGLRTTPQRHNMVGVLTEAASVRLASPIFLEKSDLRGARRGFPNHRPAVNFVDPWPGGWWRLRDIVEYELICARALLTLAARYKTFFQTNYLAMGRDAVAQGRNEPPFAWVVPSDQRDPGTAFAMVQRLHDAGVEVQRANASFEAVGTNFPEGSWILPAAQPYRPYLKDLMERQEYPERFQADGSAEPPYDVAGWTLPLQMGVRVVTVAEPFEAELETLEQLEPIQGGIDGPETPASFAILNQANDDFIVLNALLEAGVAVEALAEPLVVEGTDLPAGTLVFPADPTNHAVLTEVVPTVSTRVQGLPDTEALDQALRYRVQPQRIGVYQPWVPSMDEGWTRFVLESFQFPFETLHNADIRAGDLKDRLDTLVIPSIRAGTLRRGYAPDATEPSYVGGLGQEGIAALRQFVADGGTLVCLEDSCDFAIAELQLPVKNVLSGLSSREFYGPGSILGADVATFRELEPLRSISGTLVSRLPNQVTLGVPETISLYFDRSLAFETDEGASNVRELVHYAERDVLQSGWLLGPKKLQGKAALVEIGQGEGRVILFGFPPQHRGQPHGTFRLFFNALLRGGTNLVE